MSTDLTPPEPNIPLLRKAVEWAEAEAAKPDGQWCEWNQSAWANITDCGTAYCIAGYVATIAHPDLTVTGSQGHVWPVIEGEDVYWDDVAAIDLGLTAAEKSALFAGDNSITEVRRAAEQIAARAGERL